jgi:hypothetical protein
MLRLRTNVVLAAFMLTVPPATSAFAQDGFAKVNGISGAIFSSGGVSTTSVSGSHVDTGVYDVTFTGSYGSGVTADQVIINTTAQSFNNGVTNAIVVSVTDTVIVVRVFVWKSDTLASIDNNCFITIYIGS